MPSEKILIVDDDPDVVLFLSTVLQDHGYETMDARNGHEGLEKAKAGPPDLILLDLMMPRKSGISFLNDLRGDEKLKEIPVIMVTGVSGETGIDLESFFKRDPAGDQEGGIKRPEGIIEKPVDPERLLSLVRKALE